MPVFKTGVFNHSTISPLSLATDLNRRPADYKSAALPTELARHYGGVSNRALQSPTPNPPPTIVTLTSFPNGPAYIRDVLQPTSLRCRRKGWLPIQCPFRLHYHSRRGTSQDCTHLFPPLRRVSFRKGEDGRVDDSFYDWHYCGYPTPVIPRIATLANYLSPINLIC